MLFDSHAHYDDLRFDSEADRDSLIDEIFSGDIKYILNAGTNPVTSVNSVLLAKKYSGFYAACGLHPEDIADLSDPENALAKIKRMLYNEKVVAVGEIGLDYHYRSDNKELQKYWFRRQLELAAELSLPVIVHDREAHGDCLEAVLAYPELHGVFHSFSGSREMAAELVKRGWYISFSGVITFKNASKILEVVKSVPDDRILIETDCPYLAPQPVRGKLNHSGYLHYTAEKASEVRGQSLDDFCKMTLDNTFRLFNKAVE